MILWMQISRALLVYDVKISQLGSKNLARQIQNLAVRFDTDQIGCRRNNCQNPAGTNLIPRVDFAA